MKYQWRSQQNKQSKMTLSRKPINKYKIPQDSPKTDPLSPASLLDRAFSI